MNNRNRRKFLKLGCKTIVGAGLMSGSTARIAQAQSANSSDYRALVCIHLNGGNDGFNLLVPNTGAEYNEYANGRGHLAIPASDLLPLIPGSANSTSAGLHPLMADLIPLFEQGQLALMANVGTLVEPTTPDDVRNNSVHLPEQLFSHHDQSRQWQRLDPSHQWNSGWGGRVSDILAPQQANANLAAISLDGNNDWMAGSEASIFTIDRGGVEGYSGMENMTDDWQLPRRQAFIQLLHENYSNAFERSYAQLQQRALVLSTNVGAALAKFGELQTPVPAGNELAEQLAMVAKLIAVKDEFRMTRQLFYVNMGGFDTHDNQLADQPELFSKLSKALAFFQQALVEINQFDNVTSFTSSDFGRSITSNGDGTDHGWGNHHMVMGGSVIGGDIYGQIPRIAVDGPDDARNGRIVPTTSVAQYAATQLSWLGLNDSEIDGMLPSLKNFENRNLGFMS
ncbi:hypothetical protein AB833_22675 [Chromatiales bacterium (ex Bugula neritina AB1)]|nr:hypothetical protein AB833_22675 [Chromatiales bacterium (ex Bugula neritina AB1)]